jgi:hypothetical protein
MTAVEYKMILDHLSEKCKRVMDRDAVLTLTPALILQLTATGIIFKVLRW